MRDARNDVLAFAPGDSGWYPWPCLDLSFWRARNSQALGKKRRPVTGCGALLTGAGYFFFAGDRLRPALAVCERWYVFALAADRQICDGGRRPRYTPRSIRRLMFMGEQLHDAGHLPQP